MLIIITCYTIAITAGNKKVRCEDVVDDVACSKVWFWFVCY